MTEVEAWLPRGVEDRQAKEVSGHDRRLPGWAMTAQSRSHLSIRPALGIGVLEANPMGGTLNRLRAALGEGIEELVIACVNGDPASWEGLLGAVRRAALDLATRGYRLKPEDAEDLAQSVQLQVLQRLPQLREPRAFPRWVWRLIHHMALEALERGADRPILSLDVLAASEGKAAAAIATDPYHRVLLRADLDRVLSRLPTHYRRPIELHLLHGLSQDQVGRLLERPRSTVATQIERGLRRLRRILMEEDAHERHTREGSRHTGASAMGRVPSFDETAHSQDAGGGRSEATQGAAHSPPARPKSGRCRQAGSRRCTAPCGETACLPHL
jgi:RNA polymerase sigma factor (sigma-70 family)